METQPRLHRTLADNRCPDRTPVSEKQRERRERIIAATRTLMASFSGDHFTIGKIALALRTTPGTVRRYFVDVESILAEILFRHVIEISRAIGKIPRDAPNRRALQRAAYIEATRTGWCSLSEAHQLLIEKRNILPEDLAKPIEGMRQLIGEELAGEHAEAAFAMLDTPQLQLHQIEAMLAGLMLADSAPEAAPAEPKAPKTPAPAQHERHYRDWRLARRLKSAAKREAREARAGPPPSSA